MLKPVFFLLFYLTGVYTCQSMGGTGDEIYHHTQTQNIFNNTFVNYHGSALIASYEDPTVPPPQSLG